MSRDLESNLVTEITSSSLVPIFLCEFLFDSGAIRFWNGYGDLVWSGNTFTGAGNIIGMSEYQETQGLEAKGFTFTLSGISSTIISLALQEPYQGRVCSLYIGALDKDTGILVSDPYQLFSGLMDVMEINESGETCSISVSAESKAIIMTRAKERRYTDEDQRSEYPSDIGFNFVTQLQDKEVLWKAKA